MVRKKVDGLTDHELAIMQVFWDLSPLTIQQLLDRFPKDPKPAYTSLLTAVQALDAKGNLSRKKVGKAHEYRPIITAAQYQGKAVRKMISKVFSGNAYDLAVNIVKKENLSRDEIDSLKKLLEELT